MRRTEPSATAEPARPARRDWVVFDTNAVRALGEFDDRTWAAFASAWDRAGLRTAWAPPVVIEIAGTNLVRKRGLDVPGLRELQRAVRRYDRLSRRALEPDADELVRRSFYELAGVAVPAAPPGVQGPAWREILDTLLRASSPAEVLSTCDPDGTRRIGIRRPGATSGWEIVIPPGFGSFVRERVAATASRVSKPRAGDALERDAATVLRRWGATLGRRLGVSEEVVAAALHPSRGQELFRSPFAVRAVCEIAYDHERLPGRRTKIDDPNDQLDLALTTYLFDNRSVITDDRRLRERLLRVLQDPARMLATPRDLLTELAQLQ